MDLIKGINDTATAQVAAAALKAEEEAAAAALAAEEGADGKTVSDYLNDIQQEK